MSSEVIFLVWFCVRFVFVFFREWFLVGFLVVVFLGGAKIF